jgi:manganese/zinc/iron transport system substrate-binding protein
MKSLFTTYFFIILLLFNCNKSSDTELPKSKHGKTELLKIVTTTGMIADAAKNIGGKRVEVRALMGPGVDPHLYKASEGDVSRMANADIIFYNGLHLEGKMTEVFYKMKGRVKTVAITETIEREKLLAPPEFEGAFDPHIWFDVSLWIESIKNIRHVLVEFDNSNAEFYQKNSERYLAVLDSLHLFVLEQANLVPLEKRILITAHDAFNYFGRAYGFEVRGLQGISTASEAGTGDVQVLAEFIFREKIPAIFVETSVPPRYIEALQAAVRSRGFSVVIGGNLYSDAMGNLGTPEGTYVGMVKHNINTIVSALSK